MTPALWFFALVLVLALAFFGLSYNPTKIATRAGALCRGWWQPLSTGAQDSGSALGCRCSKDERQRLSGFKGGWWYPVQFAGVESLALDERVAIRTVLPEGSEVGPQIDRQTLRVLGKQSAPAWRLYIALCFAWDRIARNGKVPHMTRPEHRRDDAGYLLDASGKIIEGPGGAPVKNAAKTRRAVETGKREPNPYAERLHREWDAADLVTAIWPLGYEGKNPKRATGQAIEAAKRIERIGGCRIVREGRTTRGNPEAFPWRIVPPQNLIDM